MSAKFRSGPYGTTSVGGAITPEITGFFILAFMPLSASSLLSDADRDLLDPRLRGRI